VKPFTSTTQPLWRWQPCGQLAPTPGPCWTASSRREGSCSSAGARGVELPNHPGVHREVCHRPAGKHGQSGDSKPWPGDCGRAPSLRCVGLMTIPPHEKYMRFSFLPSDILHPALPVLPFPLTVAATSQHHRKLSLWGMEKVGERWAERDP
jgi:hypothetical protein